jgi:hypothetical protein
VALALKSSSVGIGVGMAGRWVAGEEQGTAAEMLGVAPIGERQGGGAV